MSHYQDQYYIDKVVNGDTNAFAVLVDRYKYMVFTLSLRIVKNREEAEEVAQDTFLKVYGSLPNFKGESKFSTWLYKIAYNRSLDYLKKEKTKLIFRSLQDFSDAIMPLEENILDHIEKEDRKSKLKKALEALPSDDSILITLHYFEELSLKEISDIMQISTNTAKVKLFRARKKLADILNYKLETKIIHNYGNK